jgi:hypothetical protein
VVQVAKTIVMMDSITGTNVREKGRHSSKSRENIILCSLTFLPVQQIQASFHIFPYQILCALLIYLNLGVIVLSDGTERK